MRYSIDSIDFCGSTSWECLVGAASRQMHVNNYGGKVYVGPEMFQTVQTQLVAMRDPTLRAEWDGNRCYLRVGICGRELVIHMREDLSATEFEMTEGPMTAAKERF